MVTASVISDAGGAAAVVARAFALGTLFDTAAAAFLVAPLFLWLGLAPGRVARHALFRISVLFCAYVAAFAALLLAVAEWLFWDEFRPGGLLA